MFSCAVGREEHCKQISLACAGRARGVWTTLACPSSQQHVLSGSTLFRLQLVLQGCCPKQALCFVHFPGLSCSGSGSQVLCKGTDSVGSAFCALPRSKQLRRPGTWRAHCPRWTMRLNHLPDLAAQFPRCAARAPSLVCRVSSGGLISGCEPPGNVNHLGSQEGIVGN